jgi:hypothetical protein
LCYKKDQTKIRRGGTRVSKQLGPCDALIFTERGEGDDDDDDDDDNNKNKNKAMISGTIMKERQ